MMATKRISAPYSFVPLNKDVYIPDWYNKVSQDIPFEDGEDGIIEVKWRNVSPLIIRDASCEKTDVAQSVFVDLPDGTRRYFIPGSSFKGMLRNVLEIMSFGKFNKYNKAHFSKRVDKKKAPYAYGVEDLVKGGQPACDTTEHDLCETIFGWTGEKSMKSMKGRVQVGHAFCDNEELMLLPKRSGVLGTPKASFYPLYLEQDEGTKKHITYDNENARVSGWKRYRIQKGSTTRALPEGNDNDNIGSDFCPLKAGLTFTMRISVHNLRKVEIGALLSAITFHETKGIWHNIGGAKSFGYGKLECVSVTLRGFRYVDKKEYLYAFEQTMNGFAEEKKLGKWNKCEQIRTLLSIASEHSDEQVKMMTLDEYKDAKSKDSLGFPCPETEKCSVIPVIPDEKRKNDVRKNYDANYAAIEALHKDGNLLQAKQKLEELIKLLQRDGVDTAPEQLELETLKWELDEQRQKDQERWALEEKARQEAYINNGLDGALNEKYPDGVRFKVDCWKTCKSKVTSWMRKNNEETLTAQEQDVLAKVVCRLKSHPKDKSEAKGWQQADSKIWKEVAAYLSKERADRLFKGEECYD